MGRLLRVSRASEESRFWLHSCTLHGPRKNLTSHNTIAHPVNEQRENRRRENPGRVPLEYRPELGRGIQAVAAQIQQLRGFRHRLVQTERREAVHRQRMVSGGGSAHHRV